MTRDKSIRPEGQNIEEAIRRSRLWMGSDIRIQVVDSEHVRVSGWYEEVVLTFNYPLVEVHLTLMAEDNEDHRPDIPEGDEYELEEVWERINDRHEDIESVIGTFRSEFNGDVVRIKKGVPVGDEDPDDYVSQAKLDHAVDELYHWVERVLKNANDVRNRAELPTL